LDLASEAGDADGAEALSGFWGAGAFVKALEGEGPDFEEGAADVESLGVREAVEVFPVLGEGEVADCASGPAAEAWVW